MKSEVIVVTERERLVELLQSVPVDCTDCRGVGTIADYLLKNRVSILPCKVGDSLYYHEHKCGAFNDNKNEWNIVDSIVCEIRIKKKGTLVVMSSGRMFTHKDFGKIIFNTKEEAKKALAERAINNEN